MNENRATLEIIAPTVEEAVAKGLGDLGLPADAVEVEVLDEGSRGLFGLGSRHARVRLIIKGASPDKSIPPPPAQAPVSAPKKTQDEPKPVPAPKKVQEEPKFKTVDDEDEDSSNWLDEAEDVETTTPGAGEEDEESEIVSDDAIEIARATVEELLERMRVRASVTAKYGPPDDRRNRPPILVDINGRDLSILIGRQAETLNALQYIAGLIVSKEIGHTVNLVVDVQGYRQRREQQIRQLARRMADQAVKSGRRQVLEPMPAAERRIIHIELRDNPYVSTESTGEEPRRKVTISPK